MTDPTPPPTPPLNFNPHLNTLESFVPTLPTIHIEISASNLDRILFIREGYPDTPLRGAFQALYDQGVLDGFDHYCENPKFGSPEHVKDYPQFREADGASFTVFGISLDELREQGPFPNLAETKNPEDPETLARRFHEAYERLAPEFGCAPREASAVSWKDMPIQNKKLMIAVAKELLGP